MKIRTASAGVSIALGAILACILLVSRESSAEVVYPVERARLSFVRQVWTRVQGFFQPAQTAVENRRLREEVGRLSSLQAELDSLERDNARLRRLLAYEARTSKTYLSAPVLSRGGAAAAAHPTIRVGKGSLNGVQIGAIAVAPEGLVGRVTAVSAHTAEISPLTDSRVKVACEIELAGKTRPFRGVLAGGSEQLLSLRYLPTAMPPIPSGSRVISSGIGGVFPRGILVGYYERDNAVRPAVDFSSLEDVFIRCEK